VGPSHSLRLYSVQPEKKKKSFIDFFDCYVHQYISSLVSYACEIRFIQVILSALELSLVRKLFLYSSKIFTPYTPLVTSLQFLFCQVPRLTYSIGLNQICKFFINKQLSQAGVPQVATIASYILIWMGLIITKMEEALKEEFPCAESAGYLHMG